MFTTNHNFFVFFVVNKVDFLLKHNVNKEAFECHAPFLDLPTSLQRGGGGVFTSILPLQKYGLLPITPQTLPLPHHNHHHHHNFRYLLKLELVLSLKL